MKFITTSLLSLIAFFAMHAAVAAGPAVSVGALYVVKASDNEYQVAKVIAVEPGTVHARRYSDKFATPPKRLDSKRLKTSAEHTAIETDAFLANNPVKVAQESVRPEELESYWIYMNSKSEIYVDPKTGK